MPSLLPSQRGTAGPGRKGLKPARGCGAVKVCNTRCGGETPAQYELIITEIGSTNWAGVPAGTYIMDISSLSYYDVNLQAGCNHRFQYDATREFIWGYEERYRWSVSKLFIVFPGTNSGLATDSYRPTHFNPQTFQSYANAELTIQTTGLCADTHYLAVDNMVTGVFELVAIVSPL